MEGGMASPLDMRDRQQQLSYNDMMDAIYQHVKEKNHPPAKRDPSIIMVTHEQYASLAKSHSDTGEYYLRAPARGNGPTTFSGIPLRVLESAQTDARATVLTLADIKRAYGR